MNKSERMAGNSQLLRTFVAIAECENITHAANALGRTQSAISVQAKNLEEVLEVSLFIRQSKGMSLTKEGERLLPVARNILSELSRVGTMFEDELQGSIRVGIPDDYAESVLETVLVNFAQSHPQVEVSARFGCTSRFPDAIKKHSLDVAVVSGTQVTNKNRIAMDANVWVASPLVTRNIEDTLPLAVLDRDCGWRDFAPNALSAVGLNWKIAYASESFAGVKAAIRSGLALGILPQSSLDPDMRSWGKVKGLPALPPSDRGILVSNSAPSRIAMSMVSAIKVATMKQQTNNKLTTN